jgi:hypothetical protein
VPDSDTEFGEAALALSVMVREAVRVPTAEGVRNITILLLLPAATEEPQVVFSLKSAALAPVMAMFEIFRAALPVFFKVITWGELAESTGSLPKVRLEGDRLTAGADAAPGGPGGVTATRTRLRATKTKKTKMACRAEGPAPEFFLGSSERNG